MEPELIEIFKTINEYPKYSISNHGNIIDNETNFKADVYINKQGYVVAKLIEENNTHHKLVHVLVAKYHVENPDPENKKIVDHIDHNRTNNVYFNLRWATYYENAINRKHKTNESKYGRGVYYNKFFNTYQARISLNNQLIILGNFKTWGEAKLKRLQAEKLYYGDFVPKYDYTEEELEEELNSLI